MFVTFAMITCCAIFFHEVNIYMKDGCGGGIVLLRVVFIKFLKCQILVPGCYFTTVNMATTLANC